MANRAAPLSEDVHDDIAAASAVQPASILIVERDPKLRNALYATLSPLYALVEAVASSAAAEELRQRCHFDLFIVSVGEPNLSGIEWLNSVPEQAARPDVIFTADAADAAVSIAALRAGARDLLIKPVAMELVVASVQRCLERREMLRENFLLRRQVDSLQAMEGLIGQSEAMQELAAVIQRIAPTQSTVLIEGETGTGKELVTRAIHKASRRKGSFVAINCGSISPELLESELFGHTRGAFTGAQSARDGLFVFAQDGTLFLDEIGEMPLSMQAKLLRVLEQRSVRPVGSDREVTVNCRVIAATNRALAELVKEGLFREDLYYRLNVLAISVPPLRDRREDIPLLARHFSEMLSGALGVAPLPFNHADIIQMQRYEWPGNVREFRNVIERSLLLGKLPGDCCVDHGQAQATTPVDTSTGYPLDWTMDDVERDHMQRVLQSVDGNKSEAARRLGVSRKTLERKVSSWLDQRE